MTKFQCMECGKRFRTTRAAERASMNGCPKCGGVDIDLEPVNRPLTTKEARAMFVAIDEAKANRGAR